MIGISNLFVKKKNSNTYELHQCNGLSIVMGIDMHKGNNVFKYISKCIQAWGRANKENILKDEMLLIADATNCADRSNIGYHGLAGDITWLLNFDDKTFLRRRNGKWENV